MAKKAGKQTGDSQPNPENVSGYFRRIFKENPKLLKAHSNQELLRRWLADHPDEKEVPNRVKQILSNVKSVLRSKRRKKRASRTSAGSTVAPVLGLPPTADQELEALEESIDQCLSQARNLQRKNMTNVIGHLRQARNEIVWKLGQ